MIVGFECNRHEVEGYLGNIGLERTAVATHEDGDPGSAIGTKGRGLTPPNRGDGSDNPFQPSEKNKVTNQGDRNNVT